MEERSLEHIHVLLHKLFFQGMLHLEKIDDQLHIEELSN